MGRSSFRPIFRGKNVLILIHNMGKQCRYCTMWADGFNGVYDHLADRAAFCVIFYEPPEIQKKFAISRGWCFPIVSGQVATSSSEWVSEHRMILARGLDIR